MKKAIASNLLLVSAGLLAASCSHGKASSTSPAGITVAIQPNAVTMAPGQMVPLAASVSGSSNVSVVWSLTEGTPGGSVTAQGLYTAPTVAGTFHVVATSQADASKSATTAVTVTTQNPTKGALAAPTALNCSAGDGQVVLTWTASAGATSYNVKRATTSGGPRTSVGGAVTGNTFTDTGLTDGTTYYYVVTAVNATGESANSNEASATPTVAQLPGVWVHPASPNPAPMYPIGDIPTAGNDLTVSIVTSRTSGVAPLYVFFDASKSPSMQVPATLNNGTNYQDVDITATYVWSFDTTSVDSNTKYDRVSGFVAGHVFNAPGTYTVRLDVFNKQRQHGSATVNITVSPFSGNTYYVASTGSDSNTGLDTSHPVQTPKHALLDLAKPNTRILFRNGDVFNLTDGNGLSLSGSGPVIISNYSDPAQPSTTAPELHATYKDAAWSVLTFQTTDWRIMNLKLTSMGQSSDPRNPGGIQTNSGAEHNLMSHLEMAHLASNAVFNLEGTANAVYECELHLFGNNGFWSSGGIDQDNNWGGYNQSNSIIGNYMHDMESNVDGGNEHAVRVQGTTGGEFIGFNVFEADGAKSGVQVRGNSTHVVLYGNVLDRSSGFHPQNDNSPPPEEIHHCSAEANIFVARVDPVTGQVLPAYNNGYTVNVDATGGAGHDLIFRNNLFYNYTGPMGTGNDTPNIPNSSRAIFENNTAVSTLPGFNSFNEANGLSLTVMNNLQYCTAHTNNQYDMFYQTPPKPPDGTTNSTSDYNQMFGASLSASWHFFGYYPNVSLAQWQDSSSEDLHSMYADPGITVMDPLAAGFAAPASTSPGVNKGTATGGWLDLYGRMRDSNPDIGAIESLP